MILWYMLINYKIHNMAYFNYVSLYDNGLNSNSQIRRSVDYVYQRGGTYEIVLTGDTYISSMQLSVDIYSNGTKVGNMQIVPYNISQSGAVYTYKFNVRPYSYLLNYTQTEHYQYYWKNNFQYSDLLINLNNPYPNSIKASFKYGYTYYSGTTQITEWAGTEPSRDILHYTPLNDYSFQGTFAPSGMTNTGNIFDYVGGAFQFDENFFLPNYDQELGTTIGNGVTISNNITTRLSPISPYLMDMPTVPEQSETSRFLTDAPRIQYIQATESYNLFYFNGQTGDRQVIPADYAVYEFYNSSNTLISTINQPIRFSGTTNATPTDYTDNLKIYALPCGPVDINNLFGNKDFNTIAYYRVQLFYSYPTSDTRFNTVGPIGPVSEAFYFYLYDNCLPENTRLVWLNDKGTYDYYTFQSYRQDTKKMTTQNYDSRYYATNLASPDRNIGRSNKTFDTQVATEIVLTSDYITIPIAQWMEQLFTSPQIYIMRDDYISHLDNQNKIYKDLRPVVILSSQVDTINKKHSKLNKYQITLKTSDSYFVAKGF